MARYSLRNEISPDINTVKAIAAEMNISQHLATLLALRDINTAEKAHEFLYADEKYFHDPLLLPDMKLSVEIIHKAIDKGDKICIYGDYDVDGVCATSILYLTLKNLGANVIYYIPKRRDEGYGLNINAILRVAKEDTSLIITVDCGISSINGTISATVASAAKST